MPIKKYANDEERRQAKLISDKKYRENNKDKKSLTDKAWRGNNKEKKKLMDKAYREKNKEKLKLQKQYYRNENIVKIKQYDSLRKKIKWATSPEYRDRLKQYRNDNKEMMQASKKKWQDSNKEYRTKYYITNKEKYSALASVRYLKNPDIVKNRVKKWREDNKDIVKQNAKKYRIENKDKISLHINRWKANNAERINLLRKKHRRTEKGKMSQRLAMQRRTHIKKNINEKILSRKEITLVFEKFKNECFKCGSKEKLQIDHHYPLKFGNPLTINNAVILCIHCNSSKSAKLPESFYSPEQLTNLQLNYGISKSPLKEEQLSLFEARMPKNLERDNGILEAMNAA